MAQIVNKLKANIYDYLVNYFESKVSFRKELAKIKVDEYEEKSKKLIEKINLKTQHQLSRYEIKAGIQSDYVQTIIKEKTETINHRFDLKERVVKQKIKRAKEESKKEQLKIKLKELVEQRKETIRALNDEMVIQNPQEVDVKAYEIQKNTLINERDELINAIESKYQAKIDSYVKKNQKAIEVNQERSKRYSKKLIALQERLKDQKNVVVLSSDTALSIRNLSMHFGGLKAVDQLTFDVKKGEIFGLIGPNGAGKTTVFNCITRFYKPTDGDMYFRNTNQKTVHLNNVSVHNIIKEGIVRTFQNVELVWELNILDNLLVAAHSSYRSKFFGHLLHSRLTKREETIFTKKALKILDDLKLTPYMYAYPIGLPYGVLKKIELARTLMSNPKMIILDEPAAGLNDAETKELAEYIKVIRDEYDLTIFLVEHDMGLVMSICDTVCAISFGKKLAIGTPKEIQKSKVVQEAYLGGE
jgi:branched-chain amino acid transport system ATP-binding protein